MLSSFSSLGLHDFSIFHSQTWKPSITMRQILIGIQDLLDNPNPESPAQDLAYDFFTEVLTQHRLNLISF